MMLRFAALEERLELLILTEICQVVPSLSERFEFLVFWSYNEECSSVAGDLPMMFALALVLDMTKSPNFGFLFFSLFVDFFFLLDMVSVTVRLLKS